MKRDEENEEWDIPNLDDNQLLTAASAVFYLTVIFTLLYFCGGY